jgi:TM2 domain-containing membrane protein YozV
MPAPLQPAPTVVVTRAEKSVGLAYVLLIFFGQLGLHRFYLSRVASGMMQLGLCAVGWATVGFFIGVIPLGILWLWLLVDLFTTAGMVTAANGEARF